MFSQIKAIAGAVGIGILLVFIFILGYFLVPAALLIGVVSIAYLLIRDHQKSQSK